VKLVNGKYEAVDNVPTEVGARTMAVDEKTHKVYLLAARWPGDGRKRRKKGRPQAVPDSFHVLIVGK